MALEVSRDAEVLAERMLVEAYELVQSGWCQGAAALDELGRSIEPSSAFARRWSAAGAIERVWRRMPGDPDAALEAFERANLALAAAIRDVPQRWNDAASRTHLEVLTALLNAPQLLAAPAHQPVMLVEDLLETLDRYDAIPGLIFDRPRKRSAHAVRPRAGA